MRTSKTLPLVVAALTGATAFAGSLKNNFSDPNNTPNLSFNGGNRADGTAYPKVEDGHLVLTYAENSLQGTVVVEDLDAGAAVSAFTVSFKLRIGGGTSTPADGLAFYFGSDIDPGANFGEEGPTPSSGITVAFDIYDNGGAEAPAIDLKLNGEVQSHNPMGIFDIISDNFTDVKITLQDNGLLSVEYKGKKYSQLLANYGYISGGRFAIGARTGGLNANHWIDDLDISTTVAPAAAGPTIATQPASVTIAEHSPVTFSVVPAGTPPFTYKWFRDNSEIPGATGPSYSLSNVPGNATGQKFKVEVTNAQGTKTSDEAVLTVTPDTTAPTLLSAKGSENFNDITLIFSEPVTPATAGALGNYSLAGGSIGSVTVLNPTTVRLTTGKQTPGSKYTLTISGVQDTASVPNTIASPTTKEFSAFVLSRGFVKFEYFGAIDGNNVSNLTDSDKYKNGTPDPVNGRQVNYLSSFDSRGIFPDDSVETYGARISGFLIPPANGDYRFFVSSDDSSSLLLSGDSDPAGLNEIAAETGCCNGFTEPETPRTSSAISLVGGNLYAIQFLYKEGVGGDYGRVASRVEGDTTPAGSLQPIPGAWLAAYADPGDATLTLTKQPANTTGNEADIARFEAAATGSPTPLLLQWQKAAPGSSTFVNIPGATGNSYTTPVLAYPGDNGTKYRVVAAVPGAELISNEATLTVTEDVTKPSIVAAKPGINHKYVLLSFSEKINAATAANASHYSINGLTVQSAAVVDAQTVRLVTSEQAENTAYTVTTTDITDLKGNNIDPAKAPGTAAVADGNKATFTSLIRVASAMRFDAYTGIGDVLISVLRANPDFPDRPAVTRLTPGFEGPFNFGDNYGATVTGFITPAKAGKYVFHVAADDNAELWLSSDDSPTNAKLIATEPVWANAREWTGDSEGRRAGCAGGACENVSAPVQLEAGKAYYAQLVYKEGGGGDHGAVAIRLETDPEPENGSGPAWGSILSTAITAEALAATTLPTSLASPVGSGSNPGINVRVYQYDQQGASPVATVISAAEQLLAGIVGPNVADLSGATGGVFAADVINFNQNGGGNAGQFEGDLGYPGIPGKGTEAHNIDSFTTEVVGYIEFPKAGVYQMGVNSDDGFKLTVGDKPPVNNGALVVSGPSGIVGTYHTAFGGTDGGGVFTPITGPITGNLVLADPSPACDPLVNAAALKGNIALIDRGVCTFSSKVQLAKNAGAIAAVIINSRDPGSADGILPIVMGGTFVDLPAVMISKPDGLAIKAALAQGLTVSITPDNTPALAEFNGSRGASDNFFSFRIAQPGVYPFRFVTYEGGGDASAEWYSFTDTGDIILVNEASPIALKSFRTRTALPPVTPTISFARTETELVITFTGTLQVADKVDGTYGDLGAATSPLRVPLTGSPLRFWRAVAR